MDNKRRQEILNKMIDIGKTTDLGLNKETQTRENISYYQDFEFGNSGLAEKNVYIVEIANQKERRVVDKNEEAKNSENASKEEGIDTTYEIYGENNQLIATVDKEGKIHFSEQYLEQLKSINKKYFEKLNLDDVYFEFPEELKEEDLVITKQELEKERTREGGLKKDQGTDEEEKELEEQDEPKEEEQEKSEIAKKKGIPTHSVLKVRENGNFYKDHPNLEQNLYFYKDKEGIIRAEYVDENGELQPSKYFEPSQTSLRQETVNLGDDGKPVVKEVPYQVMKTKNLTGKDQDIRDIRININIDTYGYLEITEARQGMNGEWASHDVEMRGRDYNSNEINEETSMRTRKANPDKQTDAYNSVEDTGLVQEGIRYDEMYLMQHSEEIIERFIEEGYQKEEAIEIFDYMIGEETLTEEEAKARVNEKVQERDERSQEKTDNMQEEDEERTPWGDTEARSRR